MPAACRWEDIYHRRGMSENDESKVGIVLAEGSSTGITGEGIICDIEDRSGVLHGRR
jgi:hypothetical protein